MPRKGEDAVALRTFLGWSPKYYRKRLVELTKVVETQMCDKNWNAINFEHVPSLAMARYGKAFDRNAPTQFAAYKNKLETGEAKINASAVYPYDVVKSLKAGNDQLANAQWNALPNFIGDASVLPMVDVSGSMTCRAGGMKEMSCLDIAISLSMYCADKNTGAFKDLFLTFSTNTKFNHLKGNLAAKYRQLSNANWDMSTNLEGAFREILRVATTNKVAPEEMPKVLLILSDMQFNSATTYNDSAIEMIRRKYAEANYQMPAIVFWNLNSYDNVPVRFDENGTALVSGFSPAIMKSVLESNYEDMTPEAMMLKAVSSDRYAL
jgi:hypothetical protein